MTQALEINLSQERLADGDPEEVATFGQLTISSGDLLLTEGYDAHLNGYRKGPYVAGYYLAEWLAWNWWRLLYEPHREGDDWLLAHQMIGIGEGYQWPNLTISSDGARTLLAARRSSPSVVPFRYAGAVDLIVPSRDISSAIDNFVSQMIERVKDVPENNLERLWRDLLAERASEETARRRRLEALLGDEPDEGDEHQIEQYVNDARRLGSDAVDEVAAEVGADGRSRSLHAADFHDLARQLGYEGRPSDGASAEGIKFDFDRGDVEPWRVGAELARRLRRRERLGDAALSDARLAEIGGVSRQSLSSSGKAGAPFSFTLESGRVRQRTVFRAGRKTGRRFDLARMVGDNFLTGALDRLHPVTDAATWRQQAQRSFAVEFLAPIEAVIDRLGGDHSLERQHDVADHFVVSPMAINSLLKNHRVVSRDDPFQNVQSAAA